MRIEVKIVDDNGDVLAAHLADASQPSMWRSPAGQRFVSDMPRQSDQPATGSYELYGFTFQPHLRVDRPNGYIAPLPSLPSPSFPNNGNSSPRPFASVGAPQSILSGPSGLSKGQ